MHLYMYLSMCVCVEGFFLLIVRIFKANKGKPNIDDVLNANYHPNAKPCPSDKRIDKWCAGKTIDQLSINA